MSPSFITLAKPWAEQLQQVIGSAKEELTISSPYVSETGAAFLAKNLSPQFRADGRLNFLTDLSPQNVYQGSTDPRAFRNLFAAFKRVQLVHLPRLHAKVYIADSAKAIVTSGNLTAGGLYRNFECGVNFTDVERVGELKQNLEDYAQLGARFDEARIEEYCQISDEVVAMFKAQEKSAAKDVRAKFERLTEQAVTHLAATKLSGNAPTSIFQRTILYLLQRHGPMATPGLHELIGQIHPDLCDDAVDRVIAGVHFGKKWKHAVRTAQQHLKTKKLVEFSDGVWRIAQ